MAVTSINYQWKIKKLECYPDENKIIHRVYWKFSATKNSHKSSTFGDIELPYNDYENENFVLYENLEESAVIEWVKHSLEQNQSWNSEENLKVSLQKNIGELELNHLKFNDLPW
jgi:hypothetical protein